MGMNCYHYHVPHGMCWSPITLMNMKQGRVGWERQVLYMYMAVCGICWLKWPDMVPALYKSCFVLSYRGPTHSVHGWIPTFCPNNNMYMHIGQPKQLRQLFLQKYSKVRPLIKTHVNFKLYFQTFSQHKIFKFLPPNPFIQTLVSQGEGTEHSEGNKCIVCWLFWTFFAVELIRYVSVFEWWWRTIYFLLYFAVSMKAPRKIVTDHGPRMLLPE